MIPGVGDVSRRLWRVWQRNFTVYRKTWRIGFLPPLLERSGTAPVGSITALYTVLVEADDMNEPVADAVRSILDGHIVLEREIAERGRYPAVNVLRSVSRTMPGCNGPQETALIGRARRLLSVYDNMAEMIRLGAYRHGSDADVDEAIRLQPALERFLAQHKSERTGLEDGFAELAALLGPAPGR